MWDDDESKAGHVETSLLLCRLDQAWRRAAACPSARSTLVAALVEALDVVRGRIDESALSAYELVCIVGEHETRSELSCEIALMNLARDILEHMRRTGMDKMYPRWQACYHTVTTVESIFHDLGLLTAPAALQTLTLACCPPAKQLETRQEDDVEFVFQPFGLLVDAVHGLQNFMRFLNLDSQYCLNPSPSARRGGAASVKQNTSLCDPHRAKGHDTIGDEEEQVRVQKRTPFLGRVEQTARSTGCSLVCQKSTERDCMQRVVASQLVSAETTDFAVVDYVDGIIRWSWDSGVESLQSFVLGAMGEFRQMSGFSDTSPEQSVLGFHPWEVTSHTAGIPPRFRDVDSASSVRSLAGSASAPNVSSAVMTARTDDA